MPLLVSPPTTTPPEVPPPTTEPAQRLIGARWTAPNGEALPLITFGPSAGIRLLAGADGFGAAPRVVTTQALATGGSIPRWSHAAERLLALPLHFHAPTNGDLIALQRTAARLFLATTPPAGTPTPGVLRITRGDGTWREISALYLDGLSWADDTMLGPQIARAVVQLVAPDPWWYGDTVVALEFGADAGRNYLAPYETVSPNRTLGAATVTVTGDVDVSPVWEITGPATTVTVRYATAGPGWTFGAIDDGETITVDVAASTVTDHTGANRVGDISWTTSRLFTLRPGDNELLLSLAGGLPGQSRIRLTYRPRWETA